MNVAEQSAIRKARSSEEKRDKKPGVTLNKCLEWLQESEGATSESGWRETAKEDYQFYAGRQDDQTTIDALEDASRPVHVFNMILSKINMLTGLAAQINKPPMLYPVTREDKYHTQLMQGAFSHYRSKSKAPRKDSECFEHMVKGGRSFLHFLIGGDNPFRPEIKCKRINAFNCWLDPISVEYDMSDARYFFADKYFSEDELLNLFDIEAGDITAYDQAKSADSPAFYDSVLDKYRVTECWYRAFTDVVWFINPLTGKQEWLLPEDFKLFTDTLAAGIPGENGENIQINPQDIKSIKTKNRKIFYKIFSGNKIIEEGITPYKHDHFPYVLYGAYKDDDLNQWFSVITMMKDPQKSLNTMRRQLQHLLHTSPKNILIHETDAVVNIEEYELRSSEPTYHMEVGAGKLDKVKFTEQPTISPVYNQLDVVFAQALKDIPGIQDSLLGIQTSSREPGITVRMRQETGIAVLYTLFRNYKDSTMLSARILLSMIIQYMTGEELIRIQGQEGMELMQINSQMNPQLSGFNDLSALEYDLEIEEGIENSTMRLTIAQLLTDFGHNNPGTIPPELIMEYANLPATVVDQVKAYNAERIKREEEMFAMELAAKSGTLTEKEIKEKTK